MGYVFGRGIISRLLSFWEAAQLHGLTAGTEVPHSILFGVAELQNHPQAATSVADQAKYHGEICIVGWLVVLQRTLLICSLPRLLLGQF